jgi:hypothetical protein
VSTVYNPYKTKGIHNIISYKNVFETDNKKKLPDDNIIDTFINTFCEYELADNDYVQLLDISNLANSNNEWFNQLSVEQVLKLLTYIIWTDKVVNNYFISRVKDSTVFLLLSRLEEIERSNNK